MDEHLTSFDPVMRLDKYLANHGGLTRNEAKAAIRDGVVTINGEVAKNAAKKVLENDQVFLLNQEIKLQGEIYLLLHKPAGVICSTKDDDHETVIDIIPDYDDLELHIAGRLDKDTTGVVLLSTDGNWIHCVSSPNYRSQKVYEVETADPIDPILVERFAKGILLKDSDKPTAPATLKITSDKTAFLTLTEGRYHQVKRMFGASGNCVTRLHRRSVGLVTLGNLEEGSYRELTSEEIQSFLKKK
jgi:16S rRNA pseudouridine516 synthase